ncbi:hypothetical protein KY328_00815 [Candidatus Woesearchaeota archaeon]|nr:hypothetical protein [Candidatus Woesearchaeota archaeon]MBW3021438.1 hypothetical protein [Candidatus Woesearchaeota archaeon]
MFKKLKEVAKSSDTVSEINATVKENKEQVNSLKEDIAFLRNQISDIKTTVDTQIGEIKELHSLFIQNFKEELEKVESFNKQFDGLIEDFRIQKQKMQETVYERATSDLNKEIDRLKTDVSRYNELKKEIDGVSSLILDMKNEASKFKEVSSKIKDQDFELVKFSNKVAQIEKEKQELMSKIDTLQRLISRERRQRS